MCGIVCWRWQCWPQHALWNGCHGAVGAQLTVNNSGCISTMPLIWPLLLDLRCAAAPTINFWKNKTYSFIGLSLIVIFFLRLAIWVVLNTCPANFFCLIAVVCTSFSGINCPQVKEHRLHRGGDCSKQYVRVSHSAWDDFFCLPKTNLNLIWFARSKEGNLLVSRSCLLCALIAALGGSLWLNSQPLQGCHGIHASNGFHPFMKMWRVGWWARHYGALSPQLGLWVWFIFDI